MAITTHIRHTRRLRRGPIALLLAASLLGIAGAATLSTTIQSETASQPRYAPDADLEGLDAYQPDSQKPKITAAFPRESYRPGASARLDFYSRATRVTIQFFRAGPQDGETKANDIMLGVPVRRREGDRHHPARPFARRTPSATGRAACTSRSRCRRPDRVRAIRPPARPAGDASRRSGHADDELAGLQLPRRQRRRQARHLVRRRARPPGSAGRT